MTHLIKRKRWMLLLASCLAIIVLPGVASAETCETVSGFKGCSEAALGGSNWWYGYGTTERVIHEDWDWWSSPRKLVQVEC